MTASTISTKGKRIGTALLAAAFWLLVWQGISLLVAQELLVPAPLQVARTLGQLAGDARFWQAAGGSLLRVAVGFAAALAAGLTGRGLKLVSGGTDNHLMLMDLRETGITGKELERRLDEVYITVNKNTIPNEPLSPFVTSGVRLGTPAVTSRGLKEAEMDQIAGFIADAVSDFEGKAEAIRQGVSEICARYPLYE